MTSFQKMCARCAARPSCEVTGGDLDDPEVRQRCAGNLTRVIHDNMLVLAGDERLLPEPPSNVITLAQLVQRWEGANAAAFAGYYHDIE